MLFGTEVNVGPVDVVRWVAAPLKGAQPLVFGSCLLWPNGWWMKTPLGTEVIGPGHIVLDGVLALREWGTAAPPLFGPCLLWPRSPVSAILLSSC